MATTATAAAAARPSGARRSRVGVLAGEAFGEDAAALRVRMATSLTYGADDDERLRALESDDPAALPWIRARLDRLRAALDDLV